MQIDYPITGDQLLAALIHAVPADDGYAYVCLPRLTLDKDLPPVRFPIGTDLKEAWDQMVKDVIPCICDGTLSKFTDYRVLNPLPPSPADTIH
jgi:hypothetical protein